MQTVNATSKSCSGHLCVVSGVTSTLNQCHYHFATVTINHLSGLMHLTWQSVSSQSACEDNQYIFLEFIVVGKMHQSTHQHSDQVGNCDNGKGNMERPICVSVLLYKFKGNNNHTFLCHFGQFFGFDLSIPTMLPTRKTCDC